MLRRLASIPSKRTASFSRGLKNIARSDHNVRNHTWAQAARLAGPCTITQPGTTFLSQSLRQINRASERYRQYTTTPTSLSKQRNQNDKHKFSRHRSNEEPGGARQQSLNDDKSDTADWIRRIEPFLPAGLRLWWDSHATNPQEDISALVQIIKEAQAGRDDIFDVLSHMLLMDGRNQAVLHLTDVLLKEASTVVDVSQANPSNVTWPSDLLSGELRDEFDLEAITPTRQRFDSIHGRFRPSTSDSSDAPSATLSIIWRSVGYMVIAAAEASALESQAIMSVVHQILAKVHHHNMVPSAIYDYSLSPYSSTVNRPPMIHLLSGRILTALSDAVWRSHQAESIAKVATDRGSLEDIYKDPPGGRFRLKVRDLGPEVWLEFILWCCVETDAASVGAELVESLRKEAEQPWFAVHWFSDDPERTVPLVDWERVQMRTGGTVGRIEGYSAEQPLAAIPKHTFSAEVVLALMDAQITSIETESLSHVDVMERMTQQLANMASFLEPHSLPTEYFDYLATRFLQVAGESFKYHPEPLNVWSKMITDFWDLESAKTRRTPRPTLEYGDIVVQGHAASGILHQALAGFIEGGYCQKSIECFSTIQYLVDKSKVQSLLAFVQTPRTEDDAFFDSRQSVAQQEYVGCHGELPQHISVIFLQHMVYSQELDLAQWMVYSDDVDGPTIPRSAYKQHGIAQALALLAGATDDRALLASIPLALRAVKIKPPVTLLRNIVDAHIRLLDFQRARIGLENLRDSIAGGYSPVNLANAAATVVRLEAKHSANPDKSLALSLREAETLFRDMLNGKFDGTPGDFYRRQKTTFRQEIGHLLRICQNLPSIRVKRAAYGYMSRYRTGNAASLRTKAFNVMLSGIVDAFGVGQGHKIWRIFCKDPRSQKPRHEQANFDRFVENRLDVDSDNNYDDGADEVHTAGPPNEAYEDVEVAHEAYETRGTIEAHADERKLLISHHEEHSFEEQDLLDPTQAELNFTTDTNAYNFVSSKPSSHRQGPESVSVLDQADPTLWHVHEQQIDFNPIVTPDSYTLRIITRKAVLDDNPTTKARITRWARGYLRSIGRPHSEYLDSVSMPLSSKERTKAESRDGDDNEWQPLPEEAPFRIRKHLVGVRGG